MDTKLTFLHNCLRYLDDRIRFVDTKVGYFLALQGGLFVVFSLLIKEIFLVKTMHWDIQLWAQGVIGFYFILLIPFGLLCITIIRPSISLWTSKVEVRKLDVSPYILWPNIEVLSKPETFLQSMEGLTETQMLQNYSRVIFTCLQLLNIKYRRYKLLTTFFKFLFMYCAFGLIYLYVLILVWHCGRFR